MRRTESCETAAGGSAPRRVRAEPRRTGSPALRRIGLLLVAASLFGTALPGDVSAQTGGGDGPTLVPGGLLRTGFRVSAGDRDRADGFEIFDARLSAAGELGIVFDYFVQGEFDDSSDELRLLDVRLTLPILPERLELGIGQFRSPQGEEALREKGAIRFIERSQISLLVAPDRQVGAQLSGRALDDRLRYAGGVFNGNGREVDNDDDEFLYAGRVSFNNVGAAEFYDEVVIEVGAHLSFSEDSLVRVGPENRSLPDVLRLREFEGDRWIFGGDLRASWRGGFLRGEYLRAEFDPGLRAEVDPKGATGPRSVRLDDVEGGYVEGGYNWLGVLEGVIRYDALSSFLPDDEVGEDPLGDFLVVGLNLFPGSRSKVALQYSLAVDGAASGVGLGDDEFALNAQVSF